MEIWCSLPQILVIWMFTGAGEFSMAGPSHHCQLEKRTSGSSFLLPGLTHLNGSQFYPSNASLQLKDLQVKDSGIYQLRVTLQQQPESIQRICLEIMDPLLEPKVSKNASRIGSIIELTCQSVFGKVDTYQWRKDGRLLPEDDRYQLSGNNSTLYIQKAQQSDCGNYSCLVRNEVSSNSSLLQLNFKGVSFLMELVFGISFFSLICCLIVSTVFCLQGCQAENGISLGHLVAVALCILLTLIKLVTVIKTWYGIPWCSSIHFCFKMLIDVSCMLIITVVNIILITLFLEQFGHWKKNSHPGDIPQNEIMLEQAQGTAEEVS
ncbi:HEPACAM family member 2-like isoform X3 [Ornithorhynchus anatinus]|uniref:HEPACAM family member 2-like isoform X3 n=1 Tax=Ornithorhynchus anatinus TaxID=9258 RepID=UPI0019D42E54|nr:HEPACAM family member 2-like isoform X3 [Ornithorhynchus anatinus]